MIVVWIVLSVVGVAACIAIAMLVLRNKKKAEINAPQKDVSQTPKQEVTPEPAKNEAETIESVENKTDETVENENVTGTAERDKTDESVKIDNASVTETTETTVSVTETVESDEKSDGSDEVAANDESSCTVSEQEPVTEIVKPRTVVVRYNKSFLAKLIQSGEVTKQYYSEIKNNLLKLKRVKSRVSWKCETFRVGRKPIARLRLRGKTLALCLALDPEAYAQTKYRVENVGNVKSYADTPCAYRIKNNRRLGYTKDLISKLATENGLTEIATENTDYVTLYPYEETDALIERKLIKVNNNPVQSINIVKPTQAPEKENKIEPVQENKPDKKIEPIQIQESVAATEVDKIMSDEVAASLVEKTYGKVDKTKQGIINIDTLSQYFEGGENVTLSEIKKRIKGFGKITYIKVLARGTLNKPLTVEADSFSLQAVKMIVLTGGKAINKRAQ